MKKALLLSIIALFMQPITASTEVTFFDPKDVDSNGWLSFDTQEKINRYLKWIKFCPCFWIWFELY